MFFKLWQVDWINEKLDEAEGSESTLDGLSHVRDPSNDIQAVYIAYSKIQKYLYFLLLSSIQEYFNVY